MDTWQVEDRAGLGNTAGYVQKIISVPLDNGAGEFDLYYFYPDFPLPKKLNPRTLLFCSGGPGRVIKPHDSLWFKDLSMKGYRIVYFHLRGSGFSQLPASNDHDQYIRTKYAVDDMEAIRVDLSKDVNGGIDKWDAVVGYSYGAILAQRYANKYKDRVEKVILLGPISLDEFTRGDAIEAYKKYDSDVRRIRKAIVDRIYDLKAFEALPEKKKHEIKTLLFGDEQVSETSKPHALGIFRRIEKYFGNEQSVLDNFGKIRGSLLDHDLPVAPKFFEVIRELQLYGSRTDNDGPVNQEEKLTTIGRIIAENVVGWSQKSPGPEPVSSAANARTNAPRSSRVFEVMSIYDGLNRRFVRELRSSKGNDITGAMLAAAGEVFSKSPAVIPASSKIGLTEELIEPWTPQKFKQPRPTLIIKGLADPVTAGDQPESYRGAVGPGSMLLRFDGVGHEFVIPGVNVQSEYVDPDLRGGNADTLNCLVHAFIENTSDHFQKAAKQICKGLEVEEHLDVSITPIGRAGNVGMGGTGKKA